MEELLSVFVASRAFGDSPPQEKTKIEDNINKLFLSMVDKVAANVGRLCDGLAIAARQPITNAEQR